MICIDAMSGAATGAWAGVASGGRPTLVFVHGWSFDPAFWAPLRAALHAWPQHTLDLGYYGGEAASAMLPEGPLVIVGHSFGFMHALDAFAGLDARTAAWISINGFARFSAGEGFPQGVAARVVQRMLARLPQAPDAVVADFRQRCGAHTDQRPLRLETLQRDLSAMLSGDARSRLARRHVPLLALAGDADPIVPAAMTAAQFSPHHIRWRAGGGHLLPCTDAQWCADHIQMFLAKLAGGDTARRARIGRAFGAAADTYAGHAAVQSIVADDLMRRIAALDLPVRPRILEIGCGTGNLTRKLAAHFTDAEWIITDLAPAMVQATRDTVSLGGRARFLVMDGEFPSLLLGTEADAEQGFDLICSSMAVQWFDDLNGGLRRLAALLRPGGCLCVSTLAGGTFEEWGVAHVEEGLIAGTPAYPAAEDIGAGLGLCGRVDVQRVVHACGSGRAFARGLKAIGAGTPAASAIPLSPPQLRRVCARFDAQGARVTYNVAYGLWRKARLPRGVFVTGTDTDVGKTLVSAILAKAWQADYWKPFQTGVAELPADTDTVAALLGAPGAGERAHVLHPPAYILQAALSPLAAAQCENVEIRANALRLPDTAAPLVVEGAGGLYVPVDETTMMIDLAESLALPVVLVARSTLGTINHTLLSLRALRARGILVLGVVMSGPPSSGNADAIGRFGGVPVIAQIPHMDRLDADAVAAAAAAIPALEALMTGSCRPGQQGPDDMRGAA